MPDQSDQLIDGSNVSEDEKAQSSLPVRQISERLNQDLRSVDPVQCYQRASTRINAMLSQSTNRPDTNLKTNIIVGPWLTIKNCKKGLRQHVTSEWAEMVVVNSIHSIDFC